MNKNRWVPTFILTFLLSLAAYAATTYNFAPGLNGEQNSAWTTILNLFVQLDGSRDMTGDLSINATNKGLKIKAGAGNRLGSIDFVTGGLTVISNSSVTANTKCFLQATTANVGAGAMACTNQVGVGVALVTLAPQTNSYSFFLIEGQ